MDQLQRVLQNLIDRGCVPGLAIQVNCKGKVRLQSGYGLADVENNRVVDPKRTLFRAGSISKSITATALAALVQESKLALDDKVTCFVPEFRNSEVSIRNLIGHTSGIRSYRGKELLLNIPMSAEDGLNLFKDDPLQFTPGTDFLYSTYNFVLLALVMERVTGVSYETLVRTYVLNPFGMNHTLPEVSTDTIEGCAKFYFRSSSGFKPAPPVAHEYKLGGGGFLTTVEDICLFGQHILYQRMADDPINDTYFAPQQLKTRMISYGLGWQLAPPNAKRKFFGHEGTGIGGRGFLYVFPDLELVVTLLCNCTRPTFDTEVSMLVEEICKAAEADWTAIN